MGSTVSAVKRVQFRLRAEDKGLLQLAASYEGESLSAFIALLSSATKGSFSAEKMPR